MALQETLRYSQAGLTQVFYGVTVPFPWVLVCNIVLFVPYKHLRFHQSCGSCVIKSHFPSKSDSLGIPIPLPNSRVGKSDVGPRSFAVGELLWYCGSPVCGSPTQQVWDLILSWLRPSYHLTAASPLSLDMGYRFFDSNILLSVVVQQLVVILVFPQEISAHLEITILLSFTMNLTTLGTSYKWSPTVQSPLDIPGALFP